MKMGKYDLMDLVQNIQKEIEKAYDRGYEQCRKDLTQKILSQMGENENKNAILELGKTYKFSDYEWTVAELFDNYAVLQSHGVTHGEWAGYSMPKFGDGNFYDKDIYSLDISRYDNKTKLLYAQIHNVEYLAVNYGAGLYLIDDKKAICETYKHALVEASNNSVSFGNANYASWLGTTYISNNSTDAWVVCTDNKVYYCGYYQNHHCVIAPAFNLDISKIKVVGDEIVIKDEYR